MKKLMVGYVSRTGNTKQMAEYIAEGIRFSGNDVVVRKIAEIKDEKEIEGFDGYVFGGPTYHRDLVGSMKTFLFLAQKVNMVGKMGGAFGSYTHSGESAQMIFDTMENVYKMDMVDLGALNLKEQVIQTQEGRRACQEYGQAVGQKLA
jgi:flavorubredoxin